MLAAPARAAEEVDRVAIAALGIAVVADERA
jgi:hypothetical protein